jgi:hypothetical protein
VVRSLTFGSLRLFRAFYVALADDWRQNSVLTASSLTHITGCKLHAACCSAVGLVLAQSGHPTVALQCPLSGVKRTSQVEAVMSVLTHLGHERPILL